MNLQALTAVLQMRSQAAAVGQPTTDPQEPMPEADPVEAPTTEEPIPLEVGAQVRCGDMTGEIVEVLPEQIAYRVKCGEKEYSFAAAGVAAMSNEPVAPAEEDNDMSAIATALGLSPDATQDQIVEAIQAQKTATQQAHAALKVGALKAANCKADLADLLAEVLPDASDASIAALKAARPGAFNADPVVVAEPAATAPVAAAAVATLGQPVTTAGRQSNFGRTTKF